MMRYTAAVLIASIVGLVAVAVVGCATGHDGVLLTGCAAGIGAVPTGLLAYLRGRAVGRKAASGGASGES